MPAMRHIVFLAVSAATAIASVTHYLLVEVTWTVPGLALDDSWIHLQYARTVYGGHPWEYSPGYPSTGSTSPLWSLLLSVLFLFTRDPTGLVAGVYVLAAVLYVVCAYLVALCVWQLTESMTASILAPVAFVTIPKNTWLMLSGMETPLFMCLLLLALYLFGRDVSRSMGGATVLGIVMGLTFLARPEGILLVLVCCPLYGLMSLRQGQPLLRTVLSLLLVCCSALATVLPWVLHCLSVTGRPLPATFYAKSHPVLPFEVAVWNFWWFVFLVEMPFLSVGMVLGAITLVRGRPYVWWMASWMTVVYRLLFPYISLINNTRYLVPVFGLYLVCAVTGSALVARRAVAWVLGHASIGSPGFVARHRAITCLIIVGVIIVPSTPLYMTQADYYGNSVKNVNDMQVTIGRWLAMNTPPDAVLAVHDAGALRFFSNRTVIDVAGLVTPDMVFLNLTVRQRLEYVRDHGCEYFVFFNELMGPYMPFIGRAVTVLYTVHLDDNVICGRDTMSVYFVNWSVVVL